MNVVVLGAGLLGVTSAYFLRQQGHDVTVIDRQAAYSTPSRTPFRSDGGRHSTVMADTVPR